MRPNSPYINWQIIIVQGSNNNNDKFREKIPLINKDVCLKVLFVCYTVRKREIIIGWAGKTLDDNERQWMSFRAIHLTGPLKDTEDLLILKKKSQSEENHR